MNGVEYFLLILGLCIIVHFIVKAKDSCSNISHEQKLYNIKMEPYTIKGKTKAQIEAEVSSANSFYIGM